jgi:hypothetical protein
MGEDGVDRVVVPMGASSVPNASAVEFASDGMNCAPLKNEHPIYVADGLHLVRWTGD